MNLENVCGFQHVPKVIAFYLFPLDLVKSNFHGLHSLQQKEGQQSIRETRIGHFDARVDGNIKISKFFDEIWLWFSLRPFKLLRLLRSLRLLRILMLWYVKCKHFLIFEAKEAVEVFEVSDVIMFDEVIEAKNLRSLKSCKRLMARITSF